MRIIEDTKLDFKDVLILPKRSTLNSRSEVSLIREFKFKFATQTWSGVPIIAANMDTVGTFDMAKTLSAFKMLTCVHKHYSIDDWVTFMSTSPEIINNIVYSLGSSVEDFEKFKHIFMISRDAGTPIRKVCLDIANGYSQHFLKSIQRLREFEDLIVIAGNVVSPEMTEALILEGADIIKVGIGGGCFTPGNKVLTDRGLKNIENIKIGEKVLTHKGRYKRVSNLFIFTDKKEIMHINNIECTTNHEFYVLHKKYFDIVNDNNIHEYAEWIQAEKLSNEYMLIKHKT